MYVGERNERIDGFSEVSYFLSVLFLAKGFAHHFHHFLAFLFGCACCGGGGMIVKNVFGGVSFLLGGRRSRERKGRERCVVLFSR